MKGMLVRGLILVVMGLPASLWADDLQPALRSSATPLPVSLGRPRALPNRSAHAAYSIPSGLQTVGYTVAQPPGVLPNVTPAYTTASYPPTHAVPPMAPLASPRNVVSPEEEPSSFAVERVSLMAPVVVGTQQPAEAPLAAPQSFGGPVDAGPMLMPGEIEGDPSGPVLVDESAFPGMTDPAAALWPRVYGSAEFLLWKTKNAGIPPLLTTVTDPNNLMGVPGAIGNPDTRVLLDSTITRNMLPGGRFTLGYIVDPCKPWGIEGSYFFLGQNSQHLVATSDQFPFLARPFFAVNPIVQNGQVITPPREVVQVVTQPGLTTGSFTVDSTSQLMGAELNARCGLLCGCNYSLDVFGGPRWLYLNEGLAITENINRGPNANPFPNSFVKVSDRFNTTNNFYGGQIGLASEYRYGRWSLGVRGKLGLGWTHQTLRVAGDQTIVGADGSVQTFQGGLYALPSNIGTFSQDRFTVVPEIGVNLGYQVTDHIRIFGGWNFLYWSSVLRPGDQIDRNLDVTQIPNFNVPGVQPTGLNRPTPLLKDTDFWAQGLNLGLELRW